MVSTGLPPSPPDSMDVPWTNFVRFVRQLSHDLRNHMNAAELQAAYLSELTDDAEIKAEIKRLREMMGGLSGALQKLSATLGQPKPNVIPYEVADFVEDIRRKLTSDFPQESANVNWDIQIGEGTMEIDPQLLQEALLELFANAFRLGKAGDPIAASARLEGKSFVLVLREKKENFALPTDNWGHEPLRQVTQGHYGLGLTRVRAILEAHQGELRAEYDPNSTSLVTFTTLPLAGQDG